MANLKFSCLPGLKPGARAGFSICTSFESTGFAPPNHADPRHRHQVTYHGRALGQADHTVVMILRKVVGPPSNLRPCQYCCQVMRRKSKGPFRPSAPQRHRSATTAADDLYGPSRPGVAGHRRSAGLRSGRAQCGGVWCSSRRSMQSARSHGSLRVCVSADGIVRGGGQTEGIQLGSYLEIRSIGCAGVGR
jgi:hypothetical protein